MFLLNEKIEKEELKNYAKELYNYALTKLDKINRTPKVILSEDQENADNMFGKTGFYDPESEEIHLYITDRHAKDVLRSFAHELVHHEQNCRGDTERLDLSKTSDPAYASKDADLREMEREAFERGNLVFRDWCDIKKTELQKNKGLLKMSESKKTTNKVIKENKTKKEVEQKTSDHPYPELFEEKERLMKQRMNAHEELIYQELLKRFTTEQK